MHSNWFRWLVRAALVAVLVALLLVSRLGGYPSTSFPCWQPGRHRHVPDRAVRSAVRGGAGSRVPGPLVHRHEADVRLILHQRLGTVSVMYVPIDDEDAIDPVARSGVPRSDGDVAEQTKAHRSRSQSVSSSRCTPPSKGSI